MGEWTIDDGEGNDRNDRNEQKEAHNERNDTTSPERSIIILPVGQTGGGLSW